MSLRLPSALVVLAALSGAACSPRPAKPVDAPHTTAAAVSGDTAAKTSELEALQKRETTTPLKDFRVRAADGAIELHVLAVAPPTVKTKRVHDDSAYSIVTFSMGSDIDVTCHASRTPIDLAHWVAAIIGNIHATLRAPPAVEVEVHAGHPLMLVQTEATLVHEGKTKGHYAKFAGTHLEQGSVICVHDGVGYTQTFREVAGHVAARSVAPGAAMPSYRSVVIARSDDRVIGFDETRAWAPEKTEKTEKKRSAGGKASTGGESRQQTLSSALLAHDNGWAPADGAWVGVVDARGTVVSERTMRRIASATHVDMTLQRTSPGVYSYEGTLRGVATKGTFKSREPVVTSLSRAPAVAALVRNERKELSLSYFDEDEPAHAIKQIVKRGDAREVRFEEPVRKRTYHCVVDAQGVCTRSWRDGATWSTEQVFVAGAVGAVGAVGAGRPAEMP